MLLSKHIQQASPMEGCCCAVARTGGKLKLRYASIVGM